MINILMKWITNSILLLLADIVFESVELSAFYQAAILGLLLALTGHFLEKLMLNRGTIWLTTISDFAVAAVIVFVAANVFAGSFATFVGAMLTGAMIGFIEYFVHQWLIASGSVKTKAW